VTRRGGSKKAGGSAARADEHETYKGHDIVISGEDRAGRVVIDGEPIRYGRAGDEFYLAVYAYDRGRSLLTVVRRYIDYREAAAERRANDEGR